MSGQTPAPAQDFDDEKLGKSIGASQGPEQLGARPPVNAASKSTRPNVTPDKAAEADAKARMDAFRAQRDPETKPLGPMFVNDRAKASQRKMDENREAEKNIYTDDATAMIRRKDEQALNATGTTSANRMAQSVSKGAGAVDRTLAAGGTTAKVVDKLSGGIGETIQQVAVATQAQGMISAQKDTARQDAAQDTKKKASEAHEGLFNSLDSMRAAKTSGGGYEPGQGGALLRGMGETVRAHNNARRAAIAAGRDTIKPMSVDHTLGQEVPINVEDGTVIDSSLGDKAREHKDALKEGWTAEEKDLKQKPGQRKDGWFSKADPAEKKKWDERMSLNAEEGKKLTEDVAVVDTSAKEREKFKTRNKKGYKYGLDKDEAAEYRTARDEHAEASTNIEKAHDAHVASHQSSFDELTKTGKTQMQEDRKKTKGMFGLGGGFSKQVHLDDAERRLKEKQAELSKGINTKIANTQSAADGAKKSGDTLRHQTKLDEIAQHKVALKQIKDGSHLDLGSAVKHRNMLIREKDTGLTADQQRQHDRLRAELDKAKGDSTSGAGQTDIDARDDHQNTIDHYRFVKKHGMSAEEHDQKLEKEQRLLEIKKESDTRLTTEESKRHVDIQKERSDNKGLVKRTKKFAKDHDGEVVKDGRAGGISTSLNPDKLITTPEDARSLAMNKASRTAVRGGEVIEGNLGKARAAMESGDIEQGRNIAISGAAQGITDAALSATGAGFAVSSTASVIGKGVQAGGNIVGAATHEGADRAILAQEGRSLEHGSDGRTGRFHEVHDSVMDFHGPDAGAFKGDMAGGAKHVLSAVQSQFGDDMKDGFAGAVTGSSVVNSIADHTAAALKPVADIANDVAEVGHEGVDKVAPVAETVSEEANKLVDTAQGGATSVLGALPVPGADAVSEKIDETANTARDSIAGNTTGLVDTAHDEISKMENLDEKAHGAVIDQADKSSRDLVDAGFAKVNDLLTGPAEKEQGVIGKPLKAAPAADEPTPGAVVKPEPSVPTPVPTPVVEPDPVHKPKLDLAQVRAAGRKSTAEQAGKHHDPTSQVSDQTKQEYTAPELNQYSWKTMKTSGQRIRRGFQNAWKRTKNFGKRMSGGISRFFGR
jgi:hypothetical protein